MTMGKQLATTRETRTVQLPEILAPIKVIHVIDEEVLRRVIREEIYAAKAFAPQVVADKLLTIKEFGEEFGITSACGRRNLKAQGCPFTGEGKNTRISRHAAIEWFNNRNKNK